jgi:hypothetical protein
MLRRWIVIVLFLVIACSIGRAADPFPPTALPQVIGGGLPVNYEPSDLVWHSRLDRLFAVSDNGTVSSMKSDGSSVVNWTVPGDLEGITVANPNSNFVYLGDENPDSVREFNVVTGAVTRSFDLTPWMTGPDNLGLEALTFVPSANAEGGVFYAGLQDTGVIYKFLLPIVSSSTSTAVTFLGTITPVAGRADLSALDFDRDHQVLYAAYDTDNLLRAMKPDGTFLKEWTLPANDQEGIALHGNALYIAEDTGSIIRYAPFIPLPEPSALQPFLMGLMFLLIYHRHCVADKCLP